MLFPWLPPLIVASIYRAVNAHSPNRGSSHFTQRLGRALGHVSYVSSLELCAMWTAIMSQNQLDPIRIYADNINGIYWVHMDDIDNQEPGHGVSIFGQACLQGRWRVAALHVSLASLESPLWFHSPPISVFKSFDASRSRKGDTRIIHRFKATQSTSAALLS